MCFNLYFYYFCMVKTYFYGQKYYICNTLNKTNTIFNTFKLTQIQKQTIKS